MAAKQGWLYCITAAIYKANDTYKCGYTATKGLEEEIAKSLQQRYGTTFPNPEILYLKRVSHPKKAEGKLLEQLLPYREEGKELITADKYSYKIQNVCSMIDAISMVRNSNICKCLNGFL